jgi:hypothetical protein
MKNAWAIVAIALGAVACSRPDKSQEAPGANASAPLELPPLPPGDRRAKPECVAPRACLHRVMPEVFDVSQTQGIEQSALGCLGGTIESAWASRECLPFAFARDTRSRQLVQVSMNCADLCPQYASLVFDFAEAVSEFECVCRGFFPVRTPGPGEYAGCAPPPPNAGSQYFGILEFPVDQGAVVQGDPRFEELGFLPGAVIDSIDGAPLSSKDELSRRLAGIPERLPGEIRMHRGTPAVTKVLHYITREVAEGLGKLAIQLDLQGVAATSTACLNPDGDATARSSLVRVAFGGATQPSAPPAMLFRKSECLDDQARRVIQFEEALQRAASEARPRAVTSNGSRGACKDVEKVRVFSIARETEKLELRYADWAMR